MFNNINPFYHASIRKSIVGFMDMLNNIRIQRYDAQGEVEKTIKVPVAYGPKQKWYVRTNQRSSADDNTPRVEMTLPRIGFEFNALDYDPERSLQPLQKMSTDDSGSSPSPDNTLFRYSYMRVPYNAHVDVFVVVKNTDDGLQILEQILPYFTPHLTMTVSDMSTLGITTDVPVVLDSVTSEDTYDGSFDERRMLIWTLGFTLKLYLYKDLKTAEIIRQVDVNFTDDERAKTNPLSAEAFTTFRLVASPSNAFPTDDDYGYSQTIVELIDHQSDTD